MVYSFVGLAAVLISCTFFKHYARFLDYVQMMFVFSAVIQASSGVVPIFSQFLDESWLSFIPNMVPDNISTFVSVAGQLITFAIVVIAFYMLLYAIMILIKCCKREFKVDRVYRPFKGLFRWFYFPLYY